MLLNHLIRPRQHRRRDREAQRLGGLAPVWAKEDQGPKSDTVSNAAHTREQDLVRISNLLRPSS